MNYNNNFDFYIDQIMNYIYKQKTYRLAYILEKDLSADYSNLLDVLINYTNNNHIMLDIDTEDTIRDFINTSSENYFIRKAMSIEKNYLYPQLFDNNGNARKDSSYSPALITIWKNDMDELYIEEVYSRFNKDSFVQFIKNNFNNISDEIISYIKDKKQDSKIVINCTSKDDVLNSVKNMILDKSLPFEWVEFLVDMDSLRNEMLLLAGDLSIYSEYDKLEDETKYCLDKHCKYTSSQLFDILTTEKGFIWDDKLGLYTI